MKGLPRLAVAAFLSLAGPLWPAASAAGDAPPASQPDARRKETPEQACERCRKERRVCKEACAGPNGDQVPSDACLDQCNNAYWRCVPPGHGCD